MVLNIKKPIIGISIGDINGIGLEVVVKICADPRLLDMCTPVIFANQKVVNYYKKTLDAATFTFYVINELQQIKAKQVNVFNVWQDDVQLQPGHFNKELGKYAVASLVAATEAAKAGFVDAIVTAPIHKVTVQSEDFQFTGHTPYLKNFFEVPEVLMMLYSGSFKVGLLSEHVPIAQAAAQVTPQNLINKISILRNALIKDFGIQNPKIAVLGLNPHAGDGGLIGNEEEEIIKPTIEKLKADNNWLLFGPYSADGFFAHGKHLQFDAVLAMYHDQGLIPLKSLGVEDGINYTCGLPIVRTSPDHGTAFDIAGKGIADESSFRNAVFEAIDITRKRLEYEEYTANPLQRQQLSKER